MQSKCIMKKLKSKFVADIHNRWLFKAKLAWKIQLSRIFMVKVVYL